MVKKIPLDRQIVKGGIILIERVSTTYYKLRIANVMRETGLLEDAGVVNLLMKLFLRICHMFWCPPGSFNNLYTGSPVG